MYVNTDEVLACTPRQQPKYINHKLHTELRQYNLWSQEHKTLHCFIKLYFGM